MGDLPAVALPMHVHGGGPSGPPPGFPVLTTVGLYGLVVLAGLLAAPAATRTVARSRLRDRFVTSLVLAYGAVSVALAVRHEVSVAVVAATLIAAGVGLVAVRRGQAGEQLAAAAVLVAAQLPVVDGDGPGRLALTVAHL